jgi:hydrogenase nickel incorporation protein HypB
MAANIPIVENILNANDQIAVEVRRQLDTAGVLALNIMASPGGGKTSTILKTVTALMGDFQIGVMDGDIVDIDLQELRAMGLPVALLNTGGNCHLDANMVHTALPTMNLAALDLLIIENVGNLICPMAYDLGEHLKVVIASVTEGADKPYKYPSMFRGADVLILNKVDLIAYQDFDVDYFRHGVEVLNPGVAFFPISCRTGEGIAAWTNWLRARILERSAVKSS